MLTAGTSSSGLASSMYNSESEQQQQQPISKKYRFSILILLSICGFSQHLSHNAYTVLQPALANSPICSNSTSALNRSVSDCCSDCLAIGNDNYNIMFSLMYSFSIVSTLVAGWAVDRYGHKVLIVICCISIAAHSLIAAAGIMRSSVAVLTLLFTGSILWGCSMLTMMTVRNKMITVWFRDKELFLAFGIASSINRCASIPTYLLIELIREKIGLQLTLFLCPMFAILSTVCAVCAIVIDAAGLKRLGLTDEIKQESSAVRISDILHLNKLFWPLVIGVSLLPGSYYTLMENSVQMVHQKFGFAKQSAAMISGVLEYVGIVMYVVTGFVVDLVGRPVFFLLISSSLIIVMSLLLAFTNVHPIVGLMGFGFEFVAFNTAGMGSIVLVAGRSNAGIASAIEYSASCFIITIAHFTSGAILGNGDGVSQKEMQLRWNRVLLLVAALGAAAFVFNSAVTCISCAQQNSLTSSRRHHTQSYEQIKEQVTDHESRSDEKQIVNQ